MIPAQVTSAIARLAKRATRASVVSPSRRANSRVSSRKARYELAAADTAAEHSMFAAMRGRVLVVAGSDSGGGAGIQADIKTITAHGAFAATAVTALTAQSTLGVFGVYPVPAAFVAQQMEVVLDDIGADIVKTGMLPDEEIIGAVARGRHGAARATRTRRRPGDGRQGRRAPDERAGRGSDRSGSAAAREARHAERPRSRGADRLGDPDGGRPRRRRRGAGVDGGSRGAGQGRTPRRPRGRRRPRQAGDRSLARPPRAPDHPPHPRHGLHPGRARSPRSSLAA
jgi:hypothetical protein